MSEGWNWFAGDGSEVYRVGPCATRDDAIAEAVENQLGADQDEYGGWVAHFDVVEACNDPLRLAVWIDVEAMIERAEERLYDSSRLSSEIDEGTIFDPTPEQTADLQRRIRLACDEWQLAHGLVFTCQTFSAMRNHERLSIRLVDEEDK